MLRNWKSEGLLKWKVKVLDARQSSQYTIAAFNGADARIMAYVLDGGFSTTEISVSSVELALAHTRILEVSDEV